MRCSVRVRAGCPVERVGQFSLGDVDAAQSVALRSRDLQFDVAPEDLGDGPIADRPAEITPCRVIYMNARDARGVVPRLSELLLATSAARSTSHACLSREARVHPPALRVDVSSQMLC